MLSFAPSSDHGHDSAATQWMCVGWCNNPICFLIGPRFTEDWGNGYTGLHHWPIATVFRSCSGDWAVFADAPSRCGKVLPWYRDTLRGPDMARNSPSPAGADQFSKPPLPLEI